MNVGAGHPAGARYFSNNEKRKNNVITKQKHLILGLLAACLLGSAPAMATPLGLTRIEEEPLFYEELQVYVGANHRLASARRVSRRMLKPLLDVPYRRETLSSFL